MCTAVATIAIFQARGGTYTWLASPADGNWDTSSLNWSDGTTDGVAWVDDASAPNDAVFPATSSQKTISISSGTRYVNDLTVNGSGYKIQGNGFINLAGVFAISQNCTISANFGGSSVHIGGTAGRVLYAGGQSSTQTATYLQGSTIFAPNSDKCYGPVPSEPTDNIFVTSGNPCLFPNATSMTLNHNRTIKLAAQATVRFGVNGGPYKIQSLIAAEKSPGCDYSTNTVVSFPGDWEGQNILDPGEGRTNVVGRINLASRLTIASGVTHVGNWKKGTDTTTPLYIHGTNFVYNVGKGNLVVSGGTLYCSQDRYVDVSKRGHVTVTGAGKVYMPNVEWLNGLSGDGRLTVTNGGEFLVRVLRISQSTASEIFLEEGGLITTTVLGIDPNASPKGTFRFNGGRLRSRDSRRNFFATVSAAAMTEAKASGIRFVVGEKGAVFDTGNAQNIWWQRPLVSGAEHDGGVRKIGNSAAELNNLVFMNTNCYNGVTVVEGGAIQLRVDNALPPGNTVRLTASGANISASTFDSEATVRHTTQWLKRVEGFGAVWNSTNIHVTNSVAPSIGGTLVFGNVCDLRGDYEIAGDANGCGLLEVRGTGQSISNLTLRVANFNALDTRAPNDRYKILKSTNGYTGKFVIPADWPRGWDVKYTDNAAYLYFQKGTTFIVR